MDVYLASFLFLIICIKKASGNEYYKTNDDINEELMRWAYAYPNLVSVYTIGNSVQERALYVVKLSTNSSIGVPNVKIIGNLHGNEPVGLYVTYELAHYLIEEFINNNVYICELLAKVNVHLLPVLNPDGYEEALEGNCEIGPGRENYNGVDLNRNFPSKTHDESITGTPEPETDAVINWMQTHFMLSAALHSGALVVNYPYDSYPNADLDAYEQVLYSKTDEDEEFIHLSRLYAKSHGAMENGCPKDHSFVDGITNGAAWYPVIGSMQDYNYDFHGCLELTIELSCCKYPHSDQLPEIWEENKNALLKFIEESQRGVKGIVLKDNIPISGAKVSISGRDMIQKTTEHGEYWRYLLPGTYYIKVEYDNTTLVKKFKVPDQSLVEPVVLNIEMNEVIYVDTITELYALDDVATISTNKSDIHLEITTSQSSTSEYLNKTVNFSSKIKVSSILIFTFILFVFGSIN